MKVCAVLCGGPSIRDVNPDWLDSRAVCAVNRSIQSFPRMTDFWVIQDPAARQLTYFPDVVKWGMRVMVRPQALVEARETFKGRPDVVPAMSRAADAERMLPRFDGRPGKCPVPAFAVAILSMLMEGFEEVEVYAADFAGSGSVLAEPGHPNLAYTPEETEADTLRWARERAMLEFLTDVAATWGSKVTHKQPLSVGF